jgi:two-component sensor histidine kinase
LKQIFNIGLSGSIDSLHEQKIRKLFNGLTFFGFFTAIFQILFIVKQDLLAVSFHASYGIYCIVALYLHHLGYYKFAKASLVTVVLIFGTLASGRIGSEYLPHLGSFGIMGAAFVFFDTKKEWGYLIFFVLLHSFAMTIVELDVLKNPDIQIENPDFLRISTIVGVALFLAVEIYTILRLSWMNEQDIITDLKETNKELQQANDEKTVMLQEIHHRVKNNLQVVISLIKLQSESISDQKTINTFDELKMRLISIARMHEMMYLSEKINKINFKTYVKELSEMILETTGNTHEIKFNVNSNIEHLSAKGIVPLALLLNELITNSIKYAFETSKSQNTIAVSFEHIDKDRYALKYSDNGRWRQKSESSKGFGLELIELLTEQLDGTAEREVSEAGTGYQFELVIK